MKNNKLNSKDILWIKNNWDKISDDFKTNLKPDNYSANLNNLLIDEHIVVLLLDRQKPSVVADYDFDRERIGVTRTGKIVWGFDSGCSCPIPFNDNYPECYNVSKTWKEFEVNHNIEGEFDTNWSEEAKQELSRIKRGV